MPASSHSKEKSLPEAFDEQGYLRFQEEILTQRHNVQLMLQEHNGSAVHFTIHDAWNTAFPRNIYHNLASIQIIKPYRGKLDIDLPVAQAMFTDYKGSGTFRSSICRIYQEEFHFNVVDRK
jgi:hypothetical protein